MSPVELQRLHRFILDTAVIEAISDEMRAVGGGGGLAGASAQAAAEEAARITPPACFSTSIRLARSSVPDYNPARPYSSLGCKTPAAYAEISPQPAITLRYHG
jgi:hypothetical protein